MKLRWAALFLVVAMVAPVSDAEGRAGHGSDQAALVAGNDAFAAALYGQLRGRSGNLLFSPASLSTGLAMAYAGARGQTAAEMATALHFTLPPDRLHPAMGALLRQWNAPHTGYQLSVADALWVQAGYSLLPDFVGQMQQDYGADVGRVDFEHASGAARDTINAWVAQKTGNQITNLLQSGSVGARTRLMLTNAAYFKGDWLTPFDKKLTGEEDFHLSPGQTVQAPMMHRQAALRYWNGGTFQALELPYQGGQLAMVVLLPNEVDGLASLEKSLTAENIQLWLGRLAPAAKIILTMPRFKTTRELNLAEELGAMGMRRAFGAGADFSGISRQPDLRIAAVVHKAYIDVDEQGTQAAAATAVHIFPTIARRPDPAPPIVFRADHPFLYLICEQRSGGVLFLGRMANPASER